MVRGGLSSALLAWWRAVSGCTSFETKRSHTSAGWQRTRQSGHLNARGSSRDAQGCRVDAGVMQPVALELQPVAHGAAASRGRGGAGTSARPSDAPRCSSVRRRGRTCAAARRGTVDRGAVGSGTLTTSTDHVLTGCAEGVGVPERAKLVSACAVPRLAAQRAVLPLLLEPLVRRGELRQHAAAAPPPASPLPPRPSAAAPLCRRPPRRRWRAKVAQVGAGRRLELLSLPPPPLPLAHLEEDRSDGRRRRHLEDFRLVRVRVRVS